MRDHTAPQDQDAGRRRLRAGAARVALDIKRKGFYGEGLKANEMAQGHSERTLEKWTRQLPSPAAASMTIDESHPKAARWPKQ